MQFVLCSTPYGIKGIGTASPEPEDIARVSKCSTPYGIKGIGTTWEAISIALKARNVLNALRHQRNWNRKWGNALPPLLSSAQRLTASKELEQLTLVREDSGIQVLNALRHQRNWNLNQTTPTLRPEKCSTPYGIKGIGTPCQPSSSDITSTCAQRLTASKELELRSLERHPRAGL